MNDKEIIKYVTSEALLEWKRKEKKIINWTLASLKLKID